MVERQPKPKVPNRGANMGWMLMVASTSKAARQAMSNIENNPPVGNVHKLPGREDATYQVAPSLSDFIRQMLQEKNKCHLKISNVI